MAADTTKRLSIRFNQVHQDGSLLLPAGVGKSIFGPASKHGPVFRSLAA